MTPEEHNHQQSFLHEQLLIDLCHDHNDSARRNLLVGAPIYYRHEAFQEQGFLIKEYSSGRIELVKADDNGNKILIKVIKE